MPIAYNTRTHIRTSQLSYSAWATTAMQADQNSSPTQGGDDNAGVGQE